MKTIINKYVLIIILILTLGCKDEFILDTKNYKPIMVVDGLITNKEGPMVKISYTLPVNYLEKIPYENCVVTLIENTGASEILTEIKPGKYVNSETGINGMAGNEYAISIFTPDGNEYHSDFEELKEPVEIDSVYAERDSLLHINYNYGLPGYQFYVNTKKAVVQENYFLWNITESFEYDADHVLAYVEDKYGNLIYNSPTYDSLYTCWKTQNVNYIFSGTTSGLSVSQVTNQPLHFVGTDTKKLTKRYCVLVQQFTIGEKAYNYWQGVEKQSSNENFFSTTQPYTILGNIENVNDEEEVVLGYFTVGSISQKRIYMEKSYDPFYYNICLVITDELSISDYKRDHQPPFFWTELEDFTFGLLKVQCIDCRTEGGDLFKPDFWNDK